MSLFSEIFVWWHGQTMGTRFYTWKYGKFVGDDDQGNRYFESAKGEKLAGYPRRWVLYNGYPDASRVPAEWHGWLHNTVSVPPTEENYVAKSWQKPHTQNGTGTANAYRPQGSIIGQGTRPKATGDYEAWKP
ncbi:MAG: NADH:ubiquinone oxidoreductase subunit NDUFA12 [Parvibaculaceae bacterium]